eukprot:m.398861 g.398861  ORF g.398861 m.398861 type:complete len:237 (+) comp16778_c0_seq44:84-794(+)
MADARPAAPGAAASSGVDALVDSRDDGPVGETAATAAPYEGDRARFVKAFNIFFITARGIGPFVDAGFRALQSHVSTKVKQNLQQPAEWSAVCPCGNANFLYDGKRPEQHGPGRANAALKCKRAPCLAPPPCPGRQCEHGHKDCKHVLYTSGTKSCEIKSSGVGRQPCHCEAIAAELLEFHLGNGLQWQQSDARKWMAPNGHWELAKLYCSKTPPHPTILGLSFLVSRCTLSIAHF